MTQIIIFQIVEYTLDNICMLIKSGFLDSKSAFKQTNPCMSYFQSWLTRGFFFSSFQRICFSGRLTLQKTGVIVEQLGGGGLLFRRRTLARRKWGYYTYHEPKDKVHANLIS